MHTLGHGTRPVGELVETLVEAGVRTLVDVRRFPGSRRNPQFNRGALETSLAQAGLGYMHAVELGGRRSGEAGEERFACINVLHLIRPGESLRHSPWAEAESRDGRLFLCGELVA